MINDIYTKFEKRIERKTIEIISSNGGSGKTLREIAIEFGNTEVASELERKSGIHNELYLGIALSNMDKTGKIIIKDDRFYVNNKEYHG